MLRSEWGGTGRIGEAESPVESQTEPGGGVTLDEKTRAVPCGQSPPESHRDPAFLRGSASEWVGRRKELPPYGEECMTSPVLYAEWSQIERSIEDAVESVLTDGDPTEPLHPSQLEWALEVAKQVKGVAMMRLDGYTAAELRACPRCHGARSVQTSGPDEFGNIDYSDCPLCAVPS
jgi:hypothetical protein